jgi:hypothetical protein
MKLVKLIVFRSLEKFSKSMVMPHQRRLQGSFALSTRMLMDYSQLSRNEKVERAREIHDNLEVNIAAYCGHKLNMKHK